MPTSLTWLSLFVFLFSNLLSQTLYKKSLASSMGLLSIVDDFKSLSLLTLGFIFQVSSIISWLFILKNNSLVWAGMMTSLLPILLVITGRIVFGEPVSKQCILGIFLVTVGLLIAHIPANK
ncbi:hypothetical protein [Vibrio sp. NH-UV-68]|uniref:hypothetical protein n=1 Tax=unclassified Vibrio TaxID=2614977 RepID=UPI0036F295D0